MKKQPLAFAIATSLLVGGFYLIPNHSNAVNANMVTQTTGKTQTSQTNATPSSVATLPQWNGVTIRDLALSVAKNNGDIAPSSIKFVKTTRQKANQFVSKSSVDSDVDTYLVVMHGNFTMVNSFGPPGSTPTGHTLAFVVDSAKGTITDFQMNNIDYDLTQLGTPLDIQ